MANPQKEHGYTAIANEIMDALCRFRIPGEERQVLDAILRQTYGWQKCEDKISMSRIAEMTGLKRPNVARAIKGLLSKRITLVIKSDNTQINTLKFNKNYEEWTQSVIKSDNSKSVIRSDNRSVIKSDTHKRNIKKERKYIKENSRKPYSDDFLVFFKNYPKKVGKDAAWKAWQKRNGSMPALDDILLAISRQKEWRGRAGPGEFRPEWKYPVTWLNQGCWADEVEVSRGKWD